ncbi:mannose-6-phosphate isomerase, class I [Arthrobacter sp. JZ12]|uniref:mannose-6-phosphate isomerase, class I n=1 Tax=Arthrobacter sp. JZ12 TaxID=2654190 RepID=UPI002B4902C7|nr:mannose-6-phosphate isomerase, class I [Arthrobacter sp. JZ12]WRH24383.1 mannose-6-phosphate isomerase, class I [Arthrobacter sp. JZ12]
MYLLDNPLRPYPWGSATAIAELLGRTPSGGPEAELWIGAHPDSPSTVLGHGDSGTPLNELVDADPDRTLGAPTREAFGDRLPFLMKVLAAAAPLSLQAHPSPDQAAAGFERENAALVPQDAPHRNYRDAFAKPEMIFALTEFDALCGFRHPREAAEVFAGLVALLEKHSGWAPGILTAVVADLRIPDEVTALREAFTRLLSGGAGTRAAVEAVVGALENEPEMGFPGSAAEGGLLRTAVETVRLLNGHHPGDPGVLVALLLNRITLTPGQALYLPAGNIHAYLEGLGIEVMGSSDNVLRGGLTGKHVDTAELLKTVEFAPLDLPLLQPESTPLGQELYCPPFDEFQLQRLELPVAFGDDAVSADIPVAQNGPAVVLVVSGTVVLDSPKGDLILHRGQSAFIPANESPVMARLASDTGDQTGEDDDGTALAFAVTVGAAGDPNPGALGPVRGRLEETKP